MANESPSGNPASSSSSSAEESSYIGSFISLISKYEMRYEGVLYFLNPQDSTLGLKNVRSYGTEGRKKDGLQIPATDKVYEYILFRGSDIKDLQVKSSPPAQTDEHIHCDPAIIQSHYAGGLLLSPSASSSGGASIESGSSKNVSVYPPPLPSGSHSLATERAAASSSAAPMYWQGYDGMSISIFHTPHSSQPSSVLPFPSTVQNQLQASEILASQPKGFTNALEYHTPVPPLGASNSGHRKISPTISEQYFTSLSNMPSSLSMTSPLPPLPPHSLSMTANGLSTISSCQAISKTEAPVLGRAVSDPVVVPFAQFLPSSASSVFGSTSGPLLTTPPMLLTPNQLAMPTPPVLSSVQKLYPAQKDLSALAPAPSNSLLSDTNTAMLEPLLPLPVSAHQSQELSQFTEEFDFAAMNEKFKKDEVWGYLGKTKPREKKEGMEDIMNHQNLVAEEACDLVPEFDSKPAYNKDDFFDTISCNSRGCGARNGQTRFSQQMKLNNETFGNFQQKSHPGYRAYGAGQGDNYRGSYNWGRGNGYGYGGRGHGRNMHF